jgi:ubiquinone/menaquinone biosynthesis C-methylase UbiE
MVVHTAPSVENAVESAPDRAALFEVWRRVLTMDNSSDPIDAVVAELSEYFRLPPDEVRDRCRRSKEHSLVAWQASDRSTPDGLVDYWNHATPVFGITMSHAHEYHGKHPASSVEIVRGLRHLEPGALLDFGAGPGTNAAFFHELGWRVTLADVSATMLDFARWRLDRRDISTATYIDTRREELPPAAFDLITAIEVMHVIPDAKGTLAELRRALKPGGLLVFNIFAPPRGRDTYSYLYEAHWPILRHVRCAGFRRRPRIRQFYVYQKVERGPLGAWAIAVLDRLRYNRAVGQVAKLVRAARARFRR